MEYTIKALADLAGISTRTLRWYDEKGIGLSSGVDGQKDPIISWASCKCCWIF